MLKVRAIRGRKMRENSVIQDGKYSGCRWTELPDAYLDQLIGQRGEHEAAATAEIRRRDDKKLPPITNEPVVSHVTFGKHRGQKWSSVPQEYLMWIAVDMPPKTEWHRAQKDHAKQELARRGAMTSDQKCRKCGGEMVFKKRNAASQAKAAQKAKSYWFKWWWKCKSCSFIQHDNTAKVMVDGDSGSTAPKKQKHNDADWELDHYRFTLPNGKETWIPNGWKVGGPNDVAPF